MSDEGPLTPGIPDEFYRADFDLLDRYQSYSSELTRLSLLGISGLAFLVSGLETHPAVPRGSRDVTTAILWAASAALFLAATACALRHRYHSTDGLFHHLRSIRLAIGREPRLADAREAEKTRNRIFERAGTWLGVAASLFAMGGLFFVMGFGRLLYVWVAEPGG